MGYHGKSPAVFPLNRFWEMMGYAMGNMGIWCSEHWNKDTWCFLFGRTVQSLGNLQGTQ